MDRLRETAARLADEAGEANQRRLLVLHGSAEATREGARRALDAAGIAGRDAVVLGPGPIEGLGAERVPPERSGQLLGTTHRALVLDAREGLDPDDVGRTVGAVDGGGLYVLLAPALDAWPGTRGAFDRRLAVPPYEVGDVAGRFRARLVSTLRGHPGVAIVDADADAVEQTGRGEVPEPREPDPVEAPEHTSFPDEVYEAARTRDQARAVAALEALLDPGSATVVEADRGRGKSSAAGLAAAGLLARGRHVLVTAPRLRNAAEVFERARELADRLDLDPEEGEDGLEAGGGRLSFRPPGEAPEAAGGADAVVVDEAAGVPVHRLEALLEGRTPLALATTIHGYEGAGRGFSVRFTDRLEASPRTVHRVELGEPIRYRAGDPVEAWSFQALLLDAAPAPASAFGDVCPEGERGPQGVGYRAPGGDELAADEALLREAFGLLVLAHYRTTPSDLARLLDAPNVALRCLTAGGRVASVALLAREGGLDPDTRARMYEGERVPGNLIPDVLTSQLRDEAAGEPAGLRVLRVATHPALRRRGLATRLLEEVAAEADADWLGTSYGATPGLLAFWNGLGYRTVHLSTRRNEASGEHSALMLAPLTEAGRALTDRSEAWLTRRVGAVLADALDELDPDVVRRALAGVDRSPELELSDREWRTVAASAFGPGVYDAAPGPFRRLALRHLVDREADLDAEAERLLVRKVLQAKSWPRVAEELGFASESNAMRALGTAMQPLVDAYGGEAAREEAGRYR